MSLIRWLPEIVKGSDQVVDVAFGEARLTLIVLAVAPRDQVVLEVAHRVALLHLELDALNAAGRGRGAVDRELHVGRLHPTHDRR